MIKNSLFAALFISAAYFFLSSHLELTLARYNHAGADAAAYMLPDGSTLAVAALNYRTAATDLVWINAVLFSADLVRTRRHPAQITDFANAIVELDPHFYPIYQLHRTVRLDMNRSLTRDDVIEINRILKVGIDHFPYDWQLPYAVAASHLGVRYERTDEQRLQDFEEIAYYSQKAAELPEAPEFVLRLATRYQRRVIRAREGLPDEEDGKVQASPEDLEFLLRRYYHAPDHLTRQFVFHRLVDLGAEDEVLSQMREFSDRFNSAHRREKYYLSPDLFSLVSVPLYNHDESDVFWLD